MDEKGLEELRNVVGLLWGCGVGFYGKRRLPSAAYPVGDEREQPESRDAPEQVRCSHPERFFVCVFPVFSK